jgi:membrane protease YdiL (CAAX protease family)
LSQIDPNIRKSGIRAFIIGILNIIFMVALQKRLPPFVLPLFFFWLIPFMITINVEKKKLEDLGIVFRSENKSTYFLYTILGFALLTCFLVLEHYVRIKLGEAPEAIFVYNEDLLGALVLQIVGIGLPEEIFFRSYLFSRLDVWLGMEKGLIISSILFGFGHFASRLYLYGYGYLYSAVAIGLQTFIAGIVLGYLLFKTESVIPSALCHILLNVFGPFISAQLLI